MTKRSVSSPDVGMVRVPTPCAMNMMPMAVWKRKPIW